MSDWYRYTDGRYASTLDEYERPVGGGRAFLHLHTFPVIRETPKGVWIELWPHGPLRFVLRGARKRFACPTQEEALESLRARKTRQQQILAAQLRHVADVLALADAREAWSCQG